MKRPKICRGWRNFLAKAALPLRVVRLLQKRSNRAQVLRTRNQRVDQATGFLESELDRAAAALGFNAAGVSSNVVALDSLRSQATLRERERRFRELLDALPAAVYTTDAVGRITYYNDAAADLWGHRPALGSSEWCGSWKLFWPDGTPLPHDECPMVAALKEDRAVRGIEVAAERPDGTR